MIATEEKINLFEEAKSQFDSIGQKWQELRAKTGEFLMEYESVLSTPAFKMLKIWIKDNYRISLAEQEVCVRVAKGEVEESVASILRPSALAKMPTSRIPKIDQKLNIYSPDTGTPVYKTVKEMTGSERKSCVTQHGVMTIDTASKKEDSRPFRCASATKWEVEDGCLFVFVGAEKLRVKVKITTDLKKALDNV